METNKPKPSGIDHIFEVAMRRLQGSSISGEDKAAIMEFLNHLLAKGVGKGRVVKYINHLTVFARMAGKPLGQLNRKDMEALMCQINLADYTDHTKHDYKVVIRKYFQWLRGCDEDSHEYPDEVKWIKTAFKKKRLLPEALLRKEQLDKLSYAAENQRDRAFVLSLYESGMRIGELLSLKIGGVSFDDKSAVLINQDGKTGPRRVRIIGATPELASWISVHPLRADHNAPLWVGVGTVGRNEQLTYGGARALLQRLVKKAGLDMRVYPHLFRHSRATEMASWMTEAQLTEHFGWVPGSNEPSRYVHLSGRDVDSAFFKEYQLQGNEQEKAKRALDFVSCPRCKQKTGTDTKFCPTCGMVLDIKTALTLESETDKANNILDVLMNNANFRRLLEDFFAKNFQELYESLRSRPTTLEGI